MATEHEWVIQPTVDVSTQLRNLRTDVRRLRDGQLRLDNEIAALRAEIELIRRGVTGAGVTA